MGKGFAIGSAALVSLALFGAYTVRAGTRQFPMIMQGASPEYDHCVAISTQASLREMIAPGALVILSPLVFGVVLGKNATAGLLCGALVSGVQLAISMSNSGVDQFF